MWFPFEAILFVFLLIIGWLVVRAKNLFAAVMLTSIFSLLCTGIYTLVDAVDVAFTEAAVGAGISTVLFLGTLALTGEKEATSKDRPLPALLVILVVGGALLYGTADMPEYGDFSAPIHHHVADRYVTQSEKEVGMPNIVTSVLASYRGYDTFGETTVVFTAAVGVLLLIGGAAPKREVVAPVPPVDEEDASTLDAPSEAVPSLPESIAQPRNEDKPA